MRFIGIALYGLEALGVEPEVASLFASKYEVHKLSCPLSLATWVVC